MIRREVCLIVLLGAGTVLAPAADLAPAPTSSPGMPGVSAAPGQISPGPGSFAPSPASPASVSLPGSPAPGQFDSLIKNSPFGQAPLPGVQPGSDGSTLEFRGVVMDKGEYFFSVYDPSTRMSQWVGMKESGYPYVVEGYDADKGTIQVKFRNQSMAVAMKRSQVVVQAMPAIAPPTAQVMPAGGSPVAVAASSPDEAARMAQVAEEIRRRRALRAPPGNLPQPNPTAVPAINPPNRQPTTNARP